MNKNDLIKPTGDDYISQGDDAITRNAEVLEQLWDDHARTADRALKVVPFQEFPGTDIQTWYGFAYEGIYRVPSTTVQDTITGYPEGAGPGTLTLTAIGSAASRAEWIEMGDMGRTWVGTISSSDAYRGAWQLVSTTKRVATSLTCGRATDEREATDVGHALPFAIAAPVYRWRLHFRNTNDRTTNTLSGALSITEIGVGVMQRKPSGEASGAIVPGTYQRIQGSGTTPASGGELLTPWVSDYPLDPRNEYVVRYGFTAASGQRVNYLEGGGWTFPAGSSDTAATAPTMTRDHRAPLDVWAEVEVDSDTPCYGYFGDSLTVGQGADLPVYESWPAKHARSRGAVPTFFAHAGSRMSEWTNPAHIKFRKYDLPNYSGTIDNPTVLYWAMGSNDLFAEDKTVEQMREAMETTFPLITERTSRNVVMTTVLPRYDATAPQEQTRRQWNSHIQTDLPHGILMVKDAAAALTIPTGGEVDPAWTTAPTDIHLSTAGYARFASAVDGGGSQPPAKEPYDSGVRDISSLLSNGWTGKVYIWRTGNAVTLRVDALDPSSVTSGSFLTLPTGFRPRPLGSESYRSRFELHTTSAAARRGGATAATLTMFGSLQESSESLYGEIHLTTTDVQPTTPPGTPA